MMPLQQTLEAALAAFQGGRVEETATLCARILKAKPRQPSALHLLGVAYLTLGQPEDAAETLAKAAHADAANPEIHANLGAALRQAGKAEDAVSSLDRALALDPGFFNARFNLANALADLGRHTAAKEAFECALGIEPDHAGAHNNLGLTLAALGDADKAAMRYRAALAIDSDHFDAHRNLARGLRERGEPHEALAHCEAACALAPENAPGDGECHNERGVVLNALERTDEALAAFRRALAIDPQLADAHVNCGNLLSAQGDNHDAIAHFKIALDIDGPSADVIANMALAQQHQGELAIAAETYRQALAIDPLHGEARFGLGTIALLEGDFATGWQGYLARESMRGAGPGYCREPLPADLAGKRILVVHDQGIGDEIFFLRFADGLRDRGASVAYRADARLAGMFARAEIAHFVDQAAKPDFDLKLSVGDLPALLGMKSARDIPPSIRLAPEPDREARLRDRLAAFGAPPYIGVTWRAGTRGRQHLLYKSVPKQTIAAALAPLDARVIVLQRQPEDGEVAAFARVLGREALDLTAMNSNIEDMLALAGLLDDQVCVSNTNVHLAATRGRTCRLLIPHPPELRWMAAGDESPWFPGMRVYRQAIDGDWGGRGESPCARSR
jgi:tetratricopeptide (TPR) repeat protein